MAKSLIKLSQFYGINTKTDALDMSEKHSPDTANCMPIVKGTISTRSGYEKDNTTAYTDGIAAIFYFKHIYASGAKKIYIDQSGNVNSI